MTEATGLCVLSSSRQIWACSHGTNKGTESTSTFQALLVPLTKASSEMARGQVQGERRNGWPRSPIFHIRAVEHDSGFLTGNGVEYNVSKFSCARKPT